MNKKVLILALVGVFASGNLLAQQASAPQSAPTAAPSTVALAPPVEATPASSVANTVRTLESLSDDNLIRGAARKNVRRDSLRSEAELIAAEGKLAQAQLANQLGMVKIEADISKAKQGPSTSGSSTDGKGAPPANAAVYREPAPVLYAIYGSGSNMVAEIYLGKSKWVAQTGSVSYSGLKVVSITDSQVILLDKKGKRQVLFVAGSVGT